MHVEAEALEPRAIGILESAKVAFATKGFEGASMQDVARAAEMSAGNVYRYFPSKDAIIEAIVERELAGVRAKFAAVIASPTPLDAFRALVRARIEGGAEPDGALWSEIEAAAARRPALAALLCRMEAEIGGNLVAVFARIAGVGRDEAERRFRPHARLIIMLVQGVTMRCAGPYAASPASPADRDLAALVVRVIETILAEVAAHRGAAG